MDTIKCEIVFEELRNSISIRVGDNLHDEHLVQIAIATVLGTEAPDTKTLGSRSVLFYKPGCSVFKASLGWVDRHNGCLQINQEEPVDYKAIAEQLRDCIAETF